MELFTISEILPNRLYLSGVFPLTRKNLRKFTLIVNATVEVDYDFDFIRVPLRDQEGEKIDPRILDVIRDEIMRGGKVLVHCYAGVSRAPTIVILYLMKYHGYNRRQAIRYVKKKRSIINPLNFHENKLP